MSLALLAPPLACLKSTPSGCFFDYTALRRTRRQIAVQFAREFGSPISKKNRDLSGLYSSWRRRGDSNSRAR